MIMVTIVQIRVNKISFCTLNRLDVGPSVSIGICIPAVCSVDHLESFVNKVIQRKASNMTIKIPRKSCQFEENATNLKTLDLAAV